MQNIFFGKDSGGKVVSVFDVESGEACGCSCMDCGRPLVAHKGGRKAWHFQHKASNGDAKCRYGEEASLMVAVKDALLGMEAMQLPPVTCKAGGRVMELVQGCTAYISGVSVVNSIPDTDKASFNPNIFVVFDDGRELCVEVCVSHHVRRAKVEAYREAGMMALEIRFSSSDFGSCRSADMLRTVVSERISQPGCSAEWLSHPGINDIMHLIEDEGVTFSNASGVEEVLCPNRHEVVGVGVCVTCPFKSMVSPKTVKCRGNLSKKDYLKLMPDAVFPPEEVNYAGRCYKCGSNKTALRPGDEGYVVQACSDCKSKTEESCPICGGRLVLRRNGQEGSPGYNSQYLSCEGCRFTLTYLTPGGGFANEVMLTGSLSDIRKDKSRYFEDLKEYKEGKKRLNSRQV